MVAVLLHLTSTIYTVVLSTFNNRLKRLLDGVPDIIVRNEKRMLFKKPVDALIDNGRRGHVLLQVLVTAIEIPSRHA